LPDVCDVLVLKNGDEIKVKAYEISGKEIKYKKCDEVNAPTYTLIKSEVLLIKHPDGTSVSPNASSETENKPTEKEESGIFGILSIACIIGSLICAIFLLGPVLVVGPVIYLEPIILLLIPMAIIFGAIGTGRKRKNRLLAILGLWLGIAAVIALMIISIIDLSHGLGGN
jgi:hypothetical protein